MARFFDPNESAEMARQEQRQAAYNTFKAMVTPQQAQQVSRFAATYPTARPGTVLALGKAGVDPLGPVAKAAAKAEAKRGLGWHSIGDAVSGAVAGAGKAIGATLGTAYDAVKGVSRGMDMGLSAIGETFQGAMRESVRDGDIQGAEWLFGLPHLRKGFAQTELAAGHREVRREGGYLGLISGKTDVDYGSGFFAGGDVRADQVQRARAAAPLINGKAVTIGRYSAAQISEPGTRRYAMLSGLLDAGVALGADPTMTLGAPVRKGLEARRTFSGSEGVREVVARGPLPSGGASPQDVARIQASQAEGLLDADEAAEAIRAAGGLDFSPRKTVLPEKVAEWLDGKEGRRLREYLAGETSFERMRQLTKGKIDVEALVRLTDAKTDAEVLSILGPKLGVEIREKVGVSKTALAAVNGDDGFRAKRVGGSKTRLAQQLPGLHMDLQDADVATETVSRFLKNVRMDKVEGLGEERIGYWTEQMARATDRNGRFAVTREMLGEVRDKVLDTSRLQPGQRTMLTRIYEDYDAELRRYAINEIGENMVVPGAIIDGAGKALPTPHLYSEYINSAVPLPDARELRRATSDFVGLVEKAHLRGTYNGLNALADFTTQQMFKPLVLLRGAWTIRVVGEEQIRLAASGMTSAFAHPLSHLAMAMGKKGGQAITGDALAASDEMQEALSRGSAGFRGDSRMIRTKHRRVLDRTEERFDEALLDEIGKLHNDPIMRRVLNGLGPEDAHPNTHLTGIDAVKDWFFNGSGSKFRKEMLNADSKGDRAWLNVKIADDGSINSADGYIDSLLERAKTTSGGDQRLLDMIATGQINGKPLSIKGASDVARINREVLGEIRKLIDEGVGPEKIAGDLLVHAKGSAGNEVLRIYDQAVETMFNTLMSKPTNFLSRSPAFQQFYWKRNAELIEFMTPETQAQALRVARESGMPGKLISQMEKAAARKSGQLNVAEADLVAKAFALDSTRKLLYDLSDRSQFFDITRAIFPFGEAWKEVATTWARIGMVDNPLVTRRAQQVVTGLRAADSDGDGEGFFHTDPQTGEEMFNYPFSGWINEKLTGVAAPFKASAQGLNIFATSVIPGAGPVVQLSVGKVLPDRPEWDGIRELILPFGETDTSGGILESFLPAWFKKARVAMGKESPSQERMYMNTVMDVSRYLVSTGEYSMDSPEEQDRLLQAAKLRAKGLYAVRALAQFFAPSPPSPEFVVRDKDGKGVLAIRMVEEFRKMQNEDYTTATERFIEKFGEDAFLTTVSKTEGGGTPTDEMYDFVRRNPEVVRQHGDVYGYFMPTTGEFSQEAYNFQLRQEQRKPIKPEEAIEIANQRLGAMVYRKAKATIGDRAPSRDERVWLAQVRDAIAEEYPGYNATPANLREQKVLIQKMVEAAKNPALAATEAGKGLTLYVAERQRALEIARERGFTTFTSSNGTADLREGLRDIAEEIGRQYPQFIELFDRTFNREMKSSETEETAA